MSITITVNGTDYPCRPTMGAMLRFKRETGREATEIDTASLSDVCTYLWCCTASASRADRLDFPYTLDDFADALPADAVVRWAEQVAAGQQGAGQAAGASGTEKKS